MRTIPLTRSPGLDLDAVLPRYWFADNAWATHLVNGLNLLFPAGERFFVRSVNYYLPRIEDPVLRAQVKGFFGQEGSHAREHERFFRVLEAQGYDIDRFLRFYQRLAYGVIERACSPALRLSVTAACEHFTAVLAEQALRVRLLDRADPALRDLLLWHAAEEIEHRAVAFDVLQQVHPSYFLRVRGLAFALILLGGFWAVATTMLLREEKDRARVRRDWRIARKIVQGPGVFVKGVSQYLRRGFHPLQNDLDTLASTYLQSSGMPAFQVT
jgi:predicted metal-dependent hydrolase